MGFFDEGFKVENHLKPSETIIESADPIEVIDYNANDCLAAKEFTRDSGLPLIRPTNDLDELEAMWNNFLQYPLNARKDSDEKSIELFGINNREHYNYLKARYSTRDIDPVLVEESGLLGDSINTHFSYMKNESVDASSKAYDLLSLLSYTTENYDGVIAHNVVDKGIVDYVGTHQNVKYDAIPFEDLPFYTSEEIIDNMAGSEEDPIGDCISAGLISENMSNWFNDYCNACVGFGAGYDPLEWKHSVEKLSFAKFHTQDEDKKDLCSRALVNLGWPSDFEYNPRNAVIATKRVKDIINSSTGSTEFVDLTGMDEDDFDIMEAAATAEREELFPVYIALFEGKAPISQAIKKVTHSTFSHAAISFDPHLKKTYSYGIDGSEKGIVGGFIQESIDNKPADKHVAVYAIFLKKPDFDKLKANIEDFVNNVSKTTYSYINLLLSYIFKIPINMKKTMVCSQFVDRMLKLIDVDISNKNSAFVAPADFEKYAKENKKIYILYDGLIGKFKGSRVKALTTRMLKKAEPIKEHYRIKITEADQIAYAIDLLKYCHSLTQLQECDSNIHSGMLTNDAMRVYQTFLQPCLYAESYFTEAKDLPVKFDDDGNLFIKNIKKRDYEAEYAKSHKLLKQYESSKNVNGMKYELCRLWAMNCIIEEKLHSKKFNELPSMAIESSKEAKARAKILNDFYYYMKIVQKHDPDFNFQEFYNDSPFNDAVIKIDKSTVKYSAELFKTIMKAL